MLHVVQLSYSCSQEKNCDNESCILYNIIGYVTTKGAHWGKNQPVPLRGIKAFCYGAPRVCPDFQGGAKKQPVPWHGGTG